MERIELKIKKPDNYDLPLPAYETNGSSGMDIRAWNEEEIILKPGDIRLVPTGISISIPPGYEAQIRPRSGLALKYGIGMVNSPGTIDSDYRGEGPVYCEARRQNCTDGCCQDMSCPGAGS